MIRKLFSKVRGDLLAASILFLAYFALGAYLSLARGYLPYDALSRLLSAYLVFHGVQAKLATIGFVWPPIPTLLILPFTLIPPLVDTWLAVVVVSAASMAFASILVGKIAKLCGVPPGWRVLLVILFAANPLMVIFGANGMSEAVLIAVSLAAFYWLLRFWQFERNTDLLLAGGWFSLIPLIRYEVVLLVAAAGLLVMVESWTKGKQLRMKDFRDMVEGRLLAFSALAIYPVFLWVVASWQIMGSPFYFLVNDRSALSLAEFQIIGYSYIGLSTALPSALGVTFGIWVAAFPLGLLASIAAIVHGVRRRLPFLVGLGLLPFVIPLMQALLLNRGSSVPLLRYFVMTVPLGVLVALATFRSYAYNGSRSGASVEHREAEGEPRKTSKVLLAVIVVIFLISNVASGFSLANYPFQNIEKSTWLALTTDKEIGDRVFNDAFTIGRLLVDIIPPGSRVLIDTYQFGFAVMLGAENPKMFMDFTDPNYDKAVLRPQDYVDYVLVPSPGGRGIFYSINRAHPTLHGEGAPWAELVVDKLPVTSLAWRLYKVLNR